MGHPPLALLGQQPMVVPLTGTVSGAPLSSSRGSAHRGKSGRSPRPTEMRADLAALLEHAYRDVALGDGGQFLEPDRGAQPGRSVATTTKSYPIDLRWLMVLSSRRNHHSTYLHCPFLDRRVNDGEEELWAGIGKKSVPPRHASHWPGGSRPGSTSPCRKRRATRRAHRRRPLARGGRASAATSPSRARRPSPSCNPGSQAAPACPSPPSPPAAFFPTDRKCRGHAAQRPPDARGCDRRPADRRRVLVPGPAHARGHRHFRRRGLQCLARLLPCARRPDERERPQGLRRHRPPPHPPCSARSACRCSAMAHRSLCSASACSKPAATPTRSRDFGRSPPSIPASSLIVPQTSLWHGRVCCF